MDHVGERLNGRQIELILNFPPNLQILAVYVGNRYQSFLR